MTQTAPHIEITEAGRAPAKKGPLTPAQQMEALRRVQAQAEQRIKVGLQLFKAAEGHATHLHTDIQQLKDEQARLRKSLEEDVARSLQSYDQWVGRMDENFTKALRLLEDKMGAIERRFNETQIRMDRMLKRAETLLEQSTQMLTEGRREHAGIRDQQHKQARVIEAQVKAHHALVARLDDMAKRLPKPVSVELPPVRTLGSKVESPRVNQDATKSVTKEHPAPTTDKRTTTREEAEALADATASSLPKSGQFKLTLSSKAATVSPIDSTKESPATSDLPPVDARLSPPPADRAKEAIHAVQINENDSPPSSVNASVSPPSDDPDHKPEVSYSDILDRIRNLSNNLNQAG